MRLSIGQAVFLFLFGHLTDFIGHMTNIISEDL